MSLRSVRCIRLSGGTRRAVRTTGIEAFAALLSRYSCCVINIPAAKTRVVIAQATWHISFIILQPLTYRRHNSRTTCDVPLNLLNLPDLSRPAAACRAFAGDNARFRGCEWRGEGSPVTFRDRTQHAEVPRHRLGACYLSGWRMSRLRRRRKIRRRLSVALDPSRQSLAKSRVNQLRFCARKVSSRACRPAS